MQPIFGVEPLYVTVCGYRTGPSAGAVGPQEDGLLEACALYGKELSPAFNTGTPTHEEMRHP
jgi:hypothetical protein